MIEPTLALQVAARRALVADPNVTVLVAPASIVDAHVRPTTFPAIVVGEGQSVREAITYRGDHVRATLDLHLWTKETGLEAVKTIAGLARAALRALDAPGMVTCHVAGVRFLRDPSGEHGHGILSLEALVDADEVAL